MVKCIVDNQKPVMDIWRNMDIYWHILLIVSL